LAGCAPDDGLLLLPTLPSGFPRTPEQGLTGGLNDVAGAIFATTLRVRH
jgi:hypothetical protein